MGQQTVHGSGFQITTGQIKKRCEDRRGVKNDVDCNRFFLTYSENTLSKGLLKGLETSE
jgi:hypothetical protein